VTSSVSAAYTTENDKLERQPVYRVTFARTGSQYSTHKICDYATWVQSLLPLAWFRLSDSSAIEDSGPHGLLGAYHNGPTLGVTGPLTGSSQTAVTFNGTNQYGTVADSPFLDATLGTISIELWIKPTNFAGNYTWIDKGTNGYMLGSVVTSGLVRISKSGVSTIVDSTVGLTAGVYNHVVAVFANSSSKIFINGVDRTGAVTGAVLAGTASALNIGRSVAGSGYTPGTFSQLALYSKLLTAADAKALYYSSLLRYPLTTEWLPYMQIPTGIAAQIEPDKGRSSVGAITFVISDQGGEVTRLIGEGIGGDTVTFEGGFHDIQGEEFGTFLTGTVESYKEVRGGYEITARDAGTLLNRSLFEVASTKLTVALTPYSSDMYRHFVAIVIGGQTIYFPAENSYDPTTFAGYLDALYGSGNWSYTSTAITFIGTQITGADTSFFRSPSALLLDEEFISFTGKTATTFTTLTRGENGSTQAGHGIGTAAKEIIHLGPDHPMDILLAIYTDTDKAGLSIDSTLVDTDTLDAIKAAYPDWQMEFWIDKRTNAKTFIETEIMAPLALYPIVKGNGLLSVKQYAAPTDADVVETITHSCIAREGKNGPPIISWDGNFDKTINHVIFRYDYDPITDAFKSYQEDTDEISISEFGERTITIFSKGLRSDLTGTDELIADRIQAYLERYSRTAPIVKVRTFLQKHLIEPGDIVSVTSDLLPNRFTHARGVTDSLFEVIDRKIAFNQGYVDLALLWTDLTVTASDDFNRADTVSDTEPDLDGLWNPTGGSTNSLVTPCVYLSQLLMGASGPIDGLNVLIRESETDGIFSLNQISELKYMSDTGGISGPAVRLVGGFLNCDGYAALYDPTNTRIQLFVFVGEAITAGTQLGSDYVVTLAEGDRVMIRAHDTEVTVYVNDVAVIGPITNSSVPVDADATVGAPGALHTSTTGTMMWDDWRGGNEGWA
jgi:hypothetical protein